MGKGISIVEIKILTTETNISILGMNNLIIVIKFSVMEIDTSISEIDLLVVKIVSTSMMKIKILIVVPITIL